MAYTYTTLTDGTTTTSADGIDFARGAREVCSTVTDDMTEGKDILFATDSRTIFTGGLEYGSYVPAADIVTAALTTSEGGYNNTSVNTLKDKPISEILDGLLFPETTASVTTGTDTKGSINPSSTLIEVGTTLPSYGTTAPKTTRTCKYIKSGTSYIQYNYNDNISTTTPAVTIKDASNATVASGSNSTFTTYTYSSTTTQSVSAPSSTVLNADGTLYCSRGSSSSVTPTASYTLGYNSGTVKTYYGLSATGVLTGSLKTLDIKSQISSTKATYYNSYNRISDGTYKNGSSTISTFLVALDESTVTYNTEKTATVEVYGTSIVEATVKIFNTATSAFDKDVDSSLYTLTSANVDKTTTLGSSYSVKKYTFTLKDLSSTYPTGASLYILLTIK